jgi:DNA-directed RNA polymerase I subunit RPA1
LTSLFSKRYVVTEGCNLRAAWNVGHGIVDLNNITSNDVAAILRTYGVEAARNSIIREISGVFGVYGIAVDYRHLSLIADYMVRSPVLLLPYETQS